MARGKPYLALMQQGTMRLFRMSASDVFVSLATQAQTMFSFDARLTGMSFTGDVSPYDCLNFYGIVKTSTQVAIQSRKLDDLSLLSEVNATLNINLQNAMILSKRGLFAMSFTNANSRDDLIYWTSTSVVALSQYVGSAAELLNLTNIAISSMDDLAIMRLTPPAGAAGVITLSGITSFDVNGFPAYTSGSTQIANIPAFANGAYWNRRSARFSPDNRKVIVAGYNTAANESFIDILQTKMDKLNIGNAGAPPTDTVVWKGRITETVGQARDVAIHPSNKFVAVGFVTLDGVTATTKIYKIDGYKLSLMTTLNGIGQALDFTADGRYLIDGVRRKAYNVSTNGTMTENTTMLVNIPAGAQVQALSKHVDQVVVGEAYDEGIKHLVTTPTNDLALKIAFLTKDAYFLATQTTLDQVTKLGAYEITGIDLPAGGIALSNVVSEKVDSSNYRLKSDNFSRLSINNKMPRYAVIYDSVTSIPIAFLNFAENVDWKTGLKLTLPLSEGFVFYSK